MFGSFSHTEKPFQFLFVYLFISLKFSALYYIPVYVWVSQSKAIEHIYSKAIPHSKDFLGVPIKHYSSFKPRSDRQ